MTWQERKAWRIPGILSLLLFLGSIVGAVIGLTPGTDTPGAPARAPGLAALFVLAPFFLKGMKVVHPNEALVLTRLGTYVGTVRKPGWHTVNPFVRAQRVSLKVRMLDSDYLKVNDRDGNPVEVSAVVIWQVRDTAKALFEVQNYVEFVALQAQAALNHVASRFPYDSHGEDRLSLSGNPGAVTDALRAELAERLAPAGLEAQDVRLRRIAYAPEVAGNMLRRQQASAVVGARAKIVEGALGMIDSALTHFETDGALTLDPARKAALVSNLLVVLCSEQHVQRVLNTGVE